MYIHTPFTPNTPHHTHHIVGVPARINLNVDVAIEPVTPQVEAWHFPSHIGIGADAAIVPADHTNVRHFPPRLGSGAPVVQVAIARANMCAGGPSSTQDPSFQGTYTEHWKSDLSMHEHIESTFANSCFAGCRTRKGSSSWNMKDHIKATFEHSCFAKMSKAMHAV